MTLAKYENSCKWVVYHFITFASLSMFWFLINSISCFCTYHLKTRSCTGGKTTLAGSYQPPNQLRTLSSSITDCLQIGFGVAVWLKTIRILSDLMSNWHSWRGTQTFYPIGENGQISLKVSVEGWNMAHTMVPPRSAHYCNSALKKQMGKGQLTFHLKPSRTALKKAVEKAMAGLTEGRGYIRGRCSSRRQCIDCVVDEEQDMKGVAAVEWFWEKNASVLCFLRTDKNLW